MILRAGTYNRLDTRGGPFGREVELVFRVSLEPGFITFPSSSC